MNAVLAVMQGEKQQPLYVVVRDGQKQGKPVSLEEASAQAVKLKALLESQGESSITVTVVPILLG